MTRSYEGISSVRSSSHSSEYPVLPETTERLDGYVRRAFRDSESGFSKFTKWTASGVIGAVAAGAVWLAADVVQGEREGYEAVSSSHAQVHEIAISSDELELMYTHHGTFVLTGLGTKNPTETAAALEVHKEVGQVFAVEYSNRDLNTKDMARRIITTADAHNLTEISFDGYSAGGPIALDIAAHIRDMNPALQIVSIVFNSSPIGDASLTEKSKEGIDLMQTLLSIDSDFAYYLRGRIAVETLARNELYVDKTPTENKDFMIQAYNKFTYDGTEYTVHYPEMVQQIHDIIDKLQNADAASAMLIWEQAKFITRTDYIRNLQKLSKDTLLFYTRAQSEAADDVVSIENSEQNLMNAANELGLDSYTLEADVGHANPVERLSQYTHLIRDRIQPAVTNALIKRMLQREIARPPATDEMSHRDLALDQATDQSAPPG